MKIYQEQLALFINNTIFLNCIYYYIHDYKLPQEKIASPDNRIQTKSLSGPNFTNMLDSYGIIVDESMSVLNHTKSITVSEHHVQPKRNMQKPINYLINLMDDLIPIKNCTNPHKKYCYINFYWLWLLTVFFKTYKTQSQYYSTNIPFSINIGFTSRSTQYHI